MSIHFCYWGAVMKEIKDTIDTITSGWTWTIASQQIQAKLYQKDWQDAVFGKSPPKTASEMYLTQSRSPQIDQSIFIIRRSCCWLRGMIQD